MPLGTPEGRRCAAGWRRESGGTDGRIGQAEAGTHHAAALMAGPERAPRLG